MVSRKLPPGLVCLRADITAYDVTVRDCNGNSVPVLLSFLYSLVRVECQAACEGVGLDPQMASCTL